jgi:hypothetical protein
MKQARPDKRRNRNCLISPQRDGPSRQDRPALAVPERRRSLQSALSNDIMQPGKGRGFVMKSTWGRGLIAAVATVVSLSAPALWAPAWADVVVQIDKSSQRMAVSVDGVPRYNWPVSTGGGGYGTPSGVFNPQSMARMPFSRKYYNSPMPHSIFFYYGFAIHGTNDIARLGGPASHGCVRLHPSHAAALFGLVQRNGPAGRDGLTAARFWPT